MTGGPDATASSHGDAGRDDAVSMSAPPDPASGGTGLAPYLGVGCLSAIAGLAGGGMLGVMAAKIVSMAQKCTEVADPRAPCNWSAYWTWGARIGVILVPSIAIWRMRRARTAGQAGTH